jgi:hypothetical protein
MIRVVHPGSRIRMLTFYPSRIPDPGVKKAPDLGSATLISASASTCCSTSNMGFFARSLLVLYKLGIGTWYLVLRYPFFRNKCFSLKYSFVSSPQNFCRYVQIRNICDNEDQFTILTVQEP